MRDSLGLDALKWKKREERKRREGGGGEEEEEEEIGSWDQSLCTSIHLYYCNAASGLFVI
jgi:hypothetical protein